MHWIYDRIDGVMTSVLAIKPDELPALKRAVQQPLKKLRKKYDELQDIHESGEATDLQETKRSYLGQEIAQLENFLNQ